MQQRVTYIKCLKYFSSHQAFLKAKLRNVFYIIAYQVTVDHTDSQHQTVQLYAAFSSVLFFITQNNKTKTRLAIQASLDPGANLAPVWTSHVFPLHSLHRAKQSFSWKITTP